MEKYRAIPQGYMKIGEIAKKAGVTVRTLKHYDMEGLLSPSAESEGGYRLYTDKDLVKLIQILMMKRLGFTLGEIKKRIVAMDTTNEVVDVLTEQAIIIRKEINHLTESLNALELLKEEIVQVNSVDFKKFADILTNLQMKNERYWLVKYLDGDVLDILMGETARDEDEKLVKTINGFITEASKLLDDGVLPESKQGQDFAKRFWGWMMELSGGDIGLIQKINEQITKSTSDKKHDGIMEKFRSFISSSLPAYFDNGFNAEAAKLYDDGVPPESEQGQDFAKRFWDWMMELTGGNVNMLQKMNEQFGNNVSDDDETSKKSQLFMGQSLEVYFSK